MISARLRALAVVLALAPAAGLLAGSPAQAATGTTLPTVKSVAVSKSNFVLSAKAGCSSITFTAALSAAMPTTGYDFSAVGVDLFAPGKSGDDTYDGVAFTRVGTSFNYRGSLKFCGKYTPGAWHAEVYGAALATGATDDSGAYYTNKVKVAISLKRPSSLTLNASPEPVKKGRTITAKGTLKIDGKVLGGAAVKIYFKAAGAKTYVLKGTAKTTSKGVYTKKFTATKTGTWKAVYAGTSTRNSAAAADAVKVKK